MQQYLLFAGFLLCLSCISCQSDSSSSTDTSLDTKVKPLHQDNLQAILQLKDSVFESSLDAYVEATILNRSKKSYTIKAAELLLAILAVQVFDAEGKLVPSIPPSVPPLEEKTPYITIKPMEAFITTYDLHIFDPLLEKGRYFIKMKNMPSNQVSFEINTATND